MSKYAVSPEGVQALKAAAAAVTEGIEKVSKEAKDMSMVADEYSGTLGPHQQELTEVLEEIEEAIEKAAEPSQNVAEKLEDVADGYQDIIDRKRFKAGT